MKLSVNIAFCTFCSGWLSGKIKPGMTSAPEGSRIAWSTESPSARRIPSNPTFQDYDNSKTWRILETLQDIAKKTGDNFTK